MTVHVCISFMFAHELPGSLEVLLLKGLSNENKTGYTSKG
jgi:hypothetical protein